MPTTDLTDGTTWSNVTLTADELWQAREGAILVTTETPARDDQGFELKPGDVLDITNGTTVYYRPIIPTGVDTKSILVREAV